MQITGYVYIPAVHRQRAWSLMPVTLLYVGNVAFALMSLQNLNIPMYNTLKRMTPVIVLATKASLAGYPSQRKRTIYPRPLEGAVSGIIHGGL